MATNDLPAIRKALETHLAAISGIPSIAFENVDFDPMDKTQWVRSQLEVVTQRPSAVGVNAQIRHEGIFLVDCFIKNQKTAAGPSAADALAQKVQDSFTYGTILTEDGKRIYIRRAERAGGRQDSPWYFVPVTVSWYCYI